MGKLLTDEELARYRANNDPAYYPDHIALVAHIDALYSVIQRQESEIRNLQDHQPRVRGASPWPIKAATHEITGE